MHGSHNIKVSLSGILITLLIIAGSCNRESFEPSNADSFIKFFAYHGIDEAVGVRATDDGRYVLAGTTETETSGANIILVITDKFGNETVSAKQFGSEGDDRAYGFTELSDGGFAILGSTSAGSANPRNIYLIRTDSQGNEIWSRSYNSNTDEVGYGLIQTRDGGFVLLGSTADRGTGNTNIRIIRTDSQGEVRWSRMHGGMKNDVGLDIMETNYGFIYTGSTQSYPPPGNDGSNIFIVKTNPSGIVTYPFTYGRSGEDFGQRIIPLPEEGYIIMGTTTDPATGVKNVYLGQIGEDISDALWTNTYGGSVDHAAACIKITPKGDFIITGTQELTEDNHVIFLLKTDPAGNEIFFRTYGGTGRQRAEGVDISNDGGYIITGSNETGGARMITLIKTDSNGELR